MISVCLVFGPALPTVGGLLPSFRKIYNAETTKPCGLTTKQSRASVLSIQQRSVHYVTRMDCDWHCQRINLMLHKWCILTLWQESWGNKVTSVPGQLDICTRISQIIFYRIFWSQEKHKLWYLIVFKISCSEGTQNIMISLRPKPIFVLTQPWPWAWKETHWIMKKCLELFKIANKKKCRTINQSKARNVIYWVYSTFRL